MVVAASFHSNLSQCLYVDTRRIRYGSSKLECNKTEFHYYRGSSIRSMEKWEECRRFSYIFGEKFFPFFHADFYSPLAFNTYTIFCGPVSSGFLGRLFSPITCMNSVQFCTIFRFTPTVHAWS